MSRKLVKDVHAMNPPGRFLKRNQITSAWEIVDDEYAREKASQCLRDAVTSGPSRERTETPERRDSSPVITPENSPKNERRKSASVTEGEVPESIHLEPLSQKQISCQSGSAARPPAPPPSALASTEAKDGSVIAAWMSMRDEVMHGSSSQMEPVPLEKVRGYEECASENTPPSKHQAMNLAPRESGDGMDLSGHSNPFSESNFALFEGELFKQDGKEPVPNTVTGNRYAVNDDDMARDENPADQEASGMAVDPQTADYAPMVTDDDLGLQLESDQTRQTEEMLVMLTDPFDSDFF